MKTYTQLINELKLPKPKNRAKTKEFVRGLRGDKPKADPIAGTEMSGESGHVLGTAPPINPETGARGSRYPHTAKPIPSPESIAQAKPGAKAKYRVGSLGMGGSDAKAKYAYTATGQEHDNLAAYHQGIRTRQIIKNPRDKIGFTPGKKGSLLGLHVKPTTFTPKQERKFKRQQLRTSDQGADYPRRSPSEIAKGWKEN